MSRTSTLLRGGLPMDERRSLSTAPSSKNLPERMSRTSTLLRGGFGSPYRFAAGREGGRSEGRRPPRQRRAPSRPSSEGRAGGGGAGGEGARWEVGIRGGPRR